MTPGVAVPSFIVSANTKDGGVGVRLALLFPVLPPPRINNETRESSRVPGVVGTKEEKGPKIGIYGCAQKKLSGTRQTATIFD